MTANEQIFCFVSPYSNDLISKMKKGDLRQFLIYLNKYYLELRKNIRINHNINFGLEIEFDLMQPKLKEKLNPIISNSKWELEKEDSVPLGGEFISPVLQDREVVWKQLNKICNILNENSVISPCCGAHIHIDNKIFDDNIDNYLNFIKIWSVYENVIFRFSYGEFLNYRDFLIGYASPVAYKFWNIVQNERNIKNFQDLKDMLPGHEHDEAVNFYTKPYSLSNFGNTIEVRCPNGTLKSVIWQNYVNFFLKLLLYCKSSNFDCETIMKRRYKMEEFYSLELYNQIYLYQALELADLIFDNNLDKIYFLRQYLKSFEISNNNQKKAKKFTK